MAPQFATEAGLVDHFVLHLQAPQTPWGEPLRAGTEFYYSRGRADVVGVAVDGEVIAFEAKLSRWRDALHQAYRNTCFAHRSYVLLPEDAAQRAAASGEFDRRGIGICYVSSDGVEVLQEAKRREPLQPWLTEAAAGYVSGPESVR